jgi:hypothetical protein
MELSKLASDRRTDPSLRDCAEDTVEDLAKRLVKVHQYLMSSDSGPLGYLYQQQVRINRELKEQLKSCQQLKTTPTADK